MPGAVNDSLRRVDGVISTLGPSETDAAHEARKFSSHVRLFPSFNEAVEYAQRTNEYALIPGGYLNIQKGKLVDAWVDLHFRLQGRMKIVDLWESATKPMCLAINRERVANRETIGSIALHPATTVFARQTCGDAELAFFDSKPLAVAATVNGEFDACIGSSDTVAASPLEPVAFFHPTMVWILYRSEQAAGAKALSLGRVSSI